MELRYGFRWQKIKKTKRSRRKSRYKRRARKGSRNKSNRNNRGVGSTEARGRLAYVTGTVGVRGRPAKDTEGPARKLSKNRII